MSTQERAASEPAARESDTRYACLIGAQKSGTTSLYRYIATHPEVHNIRWKECKFFLHDDPPVAERRRYEKLFQARGPGQLVFETSTYYTKYPQYDGVPERIKERYPEARLLYLVRDPVERIWSQYSHYLAKDWERQTFAEAVRNNSEYLDYSRYYMQLSRYLDHFPRERIRVVIFEEFIRDREAVLREVFEHMGVAADFVPDNLDVTYNAGSSKRGMSPTKRVIRSLPFFRYLPYRIRQAVNSSMGEALPEKSETFDDEVRAELVEALADDLSRFVQFLGRSVPDWRCLQEVATDATKSG